MQHMTPAQALQIAVQHHQAGRLAEAEALYRKVLAQLPGNGDALHLLGVIALQTGGLDAALELIGKALEIRPNDAVFHVNS